MKKNPHDDSLGTAYEKMFERAVTKFHSAEEKTGELFHKWIDEARDKAVELKELSEEDAVKLSLYLKRDLSDAAHYLAETGSELKDWLGFETLVIEGMLFDQLFQAANKTTLELLQMQEFTQQAAVYRTGEIMGLGTLACDQCDEKLHFHKAGKIPPCPKCHATTFHRDIVSA